MMNEANPTLERIGQLAVKRGEAMIAHVRSLDDKRLNGEFQRAMAEFDRAVFAYIKCTPPTSDAHRH